MTIVSRPSFELRDNPLCAAEGRKLLSLVRDDDLVSYIAVSDGEGECDGGFVVVSINAGSGMARSSLRLTLHPDEARALAAALAQVARFVDEAGE